MKIEILGVGCPKCEKTTENAKVAVKELGISAEIVKVTDLTEIMNYGVMITPALAIDGEVVIAGKVPGAEKVKELIEKHRK